MGRAPVGKENPGSSLLPLDPQSQGLECTRRSGGPWGCPRMRPPCRSSLCWHLTSGVQQPRGASGGGSAGAGVPVVSVAGAPSSRALLSLLHPHAPCFPPAQQPPRAGPLTPNPLSLAALPLGTPGARVHSWGVPTRSSRYQSIATPAPALGCSSAAGGFYLRSLPPRIPPARCAPPIQSPASPGLRKAACSPRAWRPWRALRKGWPRPRIRPLP